MSTRQIGGMGLTTFVYGEEFLADVEEAVIVDKSGWAFDRMQRISARLQAKDPAVDRLMPKVIWVEQATAFIAPGRYVYFSRELLQMLSEDATAFVFAHELGHQKLGHLTTMNVSAPWLAKLPGGVAFAMLARMGDDLLFSPEKEMDADRWALARCRAASFNPAGAVELFRVLEKKALDLGAVSAVFGSSDDAPKTSPANQDLTSKLMSLGGQAQRWFSERKSGYKTIRERYEAIQTQLRK